MNKYFKFILLGICGLALIIVFAVNYDSSSLKTSFAIGTIGILFLSLGSIVYGTFGYFIDLFRELRDKKNK